MASTVTDDSIRGYEAVQQRNFGDLVLAGRLGTDFHHKPEAQVFVRNTLAAILPSVASSSPRILDCGCGTGAWLEFIRDELRDWADIPSPRYYGFDLTKEMIDVARQRLPDLAPHHLRQGDILAVESYAFDLQELRFDVIFCYDVVQQLPPPLQFHACETIAAHLADGGVAVIFDQERHSLFGRIMDFAKFLRRYLGIPIPPSYYTVARYPPLKRFACRLREAGYGTTVRVAPNGRKRAMVLWYPSATHRDFR